MQGEATPEVRTGGLRRGAGLVAAVALSAVVVTSVLLTRHYRPDGGGPVRGHEASMLVAVPSLLLWGGLTLCDREVRPRRRGIGVVAAVVALALVALTAVAWQRVRWEMLGLWAVRVGDDVRGLWYAAFSDQVRFASVNGAEVSPGDMAPWVVVHLMAPVLALVAVAIGWLASEPRRPSRRSVVAPPSTDEPFELEVLPRRDDP